MAGKRFQTGVNGYKKQEVNDYLEKVFEDFEQKLADKDEEIGKFIDQLGTITEKYNDLKLREEEIAIEKEKITQALIRADETYSSIVNGARDEAKETVQELKQKAEFEREKVIDIKAQLIEMKDAAQAIIAKYQTSIDLLCEDVKVYEEDVEEIEESEKIEEIELDDSKNFEIEVDEIEEEDDYDEINIIDDANFIDD